MSSRPIERRPNEDSGAPLADRINQAAPNDTRPMDGSDRETTTTWTNDVKECDHSRGERTSCEASKKHLDPIGANYAAHSDELSIIARPILGANNEPPPHRRWQRPAHNNDSVISLEPIRASSATTTINNNNDNNNYNYINDDDGDDDGAAGRAAMVVHQDDSEMRNHTQSSSQTGRSTEAQTTSQSQLAGSNNDGGLQGSGNGGSGGQWMMSMAAQTTHEMRQRMSLASDQLGLSLRQLYASATTMAATTVDVPPSYQNIPGIVPYYRGRSSGPPPSYDDVINPYAPPPTYQSLFGQMREASKSSRGFMDLLKRLVILSTIGCSLLLAFVVLVPLSMIVVGAVYLDECRVEHIPGFLLVGGIVWASKNIIHCCVQCQHIDSDVDDELPEYGYYEEQQQQSESQQGPPNELVSGASVDTTIIMATNQGTSTDSSATDAYEQIAQVTTVRRTNTRRAMKSSICESLLNCILFGWFVAGCVIVFRNHSPDFEDPISPKFCNRTVYMYTFWLITSGLVVFALFVSCICCLMISSAIATRQDDDLS